MRSSRNGVVSDEGVCMDIKLLPRKLERTVLEMMEVVSHYAMADL